jgi:hypothetical protein
MGQPGKMSPSSSGCIILLPGSIMESRVHTELLDIAFSLNGKVNAECAYKYTPLCSKAF